MLLINKHTGEVVEWERNITYKVGKTYKSLREFCEDWEDAKAMSVTDYEKLMSLATPLVRDKLTENIKSTIIESA